MKPLASILVIWMAFFVIFFLPAQSALWERFFRTIGKRTLHSAIGATVGTLVFIVVGWLVDNVW